LSDGSARHLLLLLGLVAFQVGGGFLQPAGVYPVIEGLVASKAE
jgi:hypothetical protein